MGNEEKNDSYSHILKYTGVFGGVQIINVLIGIIRNKIVAVLLGPDGMGLMSLFNSTIKLVGDSTNLGISMSGVREISEAYTENDNLKLCHSIALIRTWSLIVSIFGIAVCILLSPLLSKWTFTDENHTLYFILLSPTIGFIAMTSGELAILKGTRQLRHLAALSIYNVIAALFISIILFYFWNKSAIVPSFVLLALSQMIITIMYSFKLYPLRILKLLKSIKEGVGMIKLGMAFVFAGILGSGAEFIIRSILNNWGGLDTVGFYNAGYMMTMTYAGMVFSAMETDYFPRLSSVCNDEKMINQTVNRQIEVSLLLITPLLIIFLITIPILLPLLYSGKFLPVSSMLKLAILAMYFRAITLPIEYIALAKGDSHSYLFLEFLYDIIIVLLVTIGYNYWQLWGTGLGLFIAGLINVITVLLYAHYKYGYNISRTIILYVLFQIPIGIATYIVVSCINGLLYWIIGFVLAIISFGFTIYILRSKTHLCSSLISKIKKRFH